MAGFISRVDELLCRGELAWLLATLCSAGDTLADSIGLTRDESGGA